MPKHDWSLRVNKQDDPVCSKCGLKQSDMARTGKFICPVADPVLLPMTPSELMHEALRAACTFLDGVGIPRYAVMLNDGKTGCAATNVEDIEEAAKFLEEAADNFRTDAKSVKQ